MLLGNRDLHWRTMIMIGQLSFTAGFTLMLLNWYFMLGDKIGVLLPVLSGSFYQGFLAGLSAVAVGVSIVFNVKGLLKRRQEMDVAR